MKSRFFVICFVLASTTSCAAPKHRIIDPIEAQLMADGLVGRMHGAVHDRNVYVFTWRKPGDFFSHKELPVVPANAEAAAVLKTLKRHDAVRIKGSFIDHQAPQRHIEAKSIERLQEYPAHEVPAATQNGDLAELLSKKEAVGKVHAIGSDGRILVFEYKSVVIPVMASDAKQTDGLYRNDKIRIRYTVKQSAHRPAHLYLDKKAKEPLTVLDSVVNGNGEPFEREGELVMFPESPQIKFDIYALRTMDADGVSIEYTLVNFSDMEVFEAIRAKLAAAWEADVANARDGRNKLVNPHLRVKASGTLNVQDPGQANPQILLTSPDDVTVTHQ